MRVLEIFNSLQGEGVWSGIPMTFVRLAGCNAPQVGLGCVRWCDTPGSWDPSAGRAMSPAEIADRVSLPRVCVTGGEPLLQGEELRVLASILRAGGARIHLETNGTLPLPAGLALDWVTVSPKPPAYTVSPGIERVDEIKVVVQKNLQADVVEALAATHPEALVSLQPEAGEAPGSTLQAIELVMAHPHWRLSLQLHKLLGLR